jgi:DNA polymerase I
MKESTDPRERQVLNVQQEARKTLISTIYGLYNHPQYRWYCIEASEAITAWGREFLKNTMKDAEKHSLKPIYADTDGFYATYTGPSEND